MPSCCSDIGKANKAARKARQASHVGASNQLSEELWVIKRVKNVHDALLALSGMAARNF